MTRSAAQMLADATAAVEGVTPQQSHAQMADGAVMLDVREPVEWEEHIAGAVQVPRGVLEFRADPASPRHHPALDPSARVIVYCRSGARSALAAATLQELGFTDVASMLGGITAWREAGLATTEAHDGF